MGAVAGAVVAVVVAAPPDRLSSLTVILGVAAVIAGLMVAGAKDGLSVSAGFIVVALAAVFLGARSAVAAGVLIEATSALRLRTRLRPVFQINLPAAVLPAIAGALVSRAQAGDEAAFREIVERYQSKVFSIIHGIVRQRNDVEDIAQQVFAKVYLSIKS